MSLHILKCWTIVINQYIYVITIEEFFSVINNFYNNKAILRKEAKQGLEPLHLTKFELANNNLQQVSYHDEEHDD